MRFVSFGLFWLLILKLSSLVAQNSCGAAGIAPGPRRLLGSLLEAAGEGARGSRGGTAGDVTAQRRSRKKGRSQIPIVTATRIDVCCCSTPRFNVVVKQRLHRSVLCTWYLVKQEVSIGVSDQPSGMTQSNESLASCQECITTWYQDMKTWCSRPPTYARESPFLFPPGRLPASVRDRAQPRRRACFAGGIRHRQKLHAARSDDPLHVSHSLAGARSMRSKLERWNVPSKTENSFW